MDALYRHAADLGLECEWRDLGDTRRGEYWDDRKLIVLNRRLTVSQSNAALAHELGHAIYGDRCSTPAAERRADEVGAALAIPISDYREAEKHVGEHAGALAQALDVTPRLVFAWRRWALRMGVVK